MRAAPNRRVVFDSPECEAANRAPCLGFAAVLIVAVCLKALQDESPLADLGLPLRVVAFVEATAALLMVLNRTMLSATCQPRQVC